MSRATNNVLKLDGYESLRQYGAPSSALAALNAMAVDFDAGGEIHVADGTWTLPAGFTFDGQRLNLKGAGRQVSKFSFSVAGTAITYDNPDAGGMYQSSISGFGFTGSGTDTKTAISLVNTANVDISEIAIADGGWLGTSIGIRTQGRQFTRITGCDIACARPVVIDNNTDYPSLAADHFLLEHNELTGTSASYPVIEFVDGTSFANTTIRGLACVKGGHGIYWNDTTSSAASFNLHIEDFRSEQGLDSSKYSIYLASTAQALQNVSIENATLDASRNGLYLRNARAVTLTNVAFDQTSGTAMDMTFVAGARLVMTNCTKQPGSAFTLTNARCVRREYSANVGMIEEWIYDSGTSAGATVSDVYHGGSPTAVANDGTTIIADETFTGFVFVSNSEDSSAIYMLRGGTHTVAEVSDPDTVYSASAGTATSTNIYWDGGTSRYLLQNKRGSSVTYSILKLGTTA